MRTSYATAAAFLVQLGVALADDKRPMDDFRSTCDPKSIKISGRYATANCRTIRGEVRCSRLDLTTCLKNTYGALQHDTTGSGPSFFNECFNCSNEPQKGGIITTAPTLLHCQCDPKTGAPRSNWPTAIIDINILVDNLDGVMQCNGKNGIVYTGC